MKTTTKLLEKKLYEARLSLEQAEVLLTNLIKLNCPHANRFVISDDDITVTLEAILKIIKIELK